LNAQVSASVLVVLWLFSSEVAAGEISKTPCGW